jgi:hypothetical protein
MNEKFCDTLEKILNDYYHGKAKQRLDMIMADAENDEDAEENVYAIMRNVIRKNESNTSQHYTLDVSGCSEACDGDQAADCYRDRRSLWVVNGREVTKSFSDWIDKNIF